MDISNISTMIKSLDHHIATWKWVEGEVPLSSWYYPVMGTLGYLALIYLIVLFMRGRKAFSMKYVSIVHNFVLVVLSLVMWVGINHAAYERVMEKGVFSLFCEATDHEVQGRIGFWIYVFYASKYYELVDTVIMALKKKPIIFLHIFHHAVMLPGTWLWLHDQFLVGSWWCVNVNSLIHTAMYYYYLQASLGRSVWWKKYMTVAQLVQFFTGFLVVSVYYILNSMSSYQCNGGGLGAAISYSTNLYFIFLFFKFYLSTYGDKEKKDL